MKYTKINEKLENGFEKCLEISLKWEWNWKWDEITVESSRNEWNLIEKSIEMSEKYEIHRKNRLFNQNKVWKSTEMQI